MSTAEADAAASSSGGSGSSSETVAARVPFSELAGLMERVSRLRGNKEKAAPLRQFASSWRRLHTELHGGRRTSDSFFPAMRLLLPLCDRARPAYGIKEFMLAKIYIDILCLGKDSPEALKLLNYKNPGHSAGTAGDFAATAFFILQRRCPQKGSLSVEAVNRHLDAVSSANAANKRDEVKRQLFSLIKQTSAIEQKWLVRVVLRELKAGFSEKTVLAAFHPDAEAYYDVTQSLEKVCLALHDEGVRLHEIGVELNTPFRPMLGEPGVLQNICQLMDSKPFVLEVKYDGERMQLHKSGGGFRYWSRSGNEWTVTYGADAGVGNLTPHIADAFLPGVDSCIVDGEMMGFNPETGAMGSKAQDFDIKRVTVRGYVPCFVAFDLILLNGKVLTDKPLLERKRMLDSQVFRPIHGRLMLSDWSIVSSQTETVEKFNAAVEAREEGLMAKRADSVYSVASRKAGWYKLKPEFVGGLTDDFDCVIVGGYFGSGHRSGMCSQFLLALPADDSASRFLSFCRVGSGYSKQTLFEYNLKLAPHWRRFDKRNPPGAFELASGLHELPDVWIEPRDSLVVQVKASEIVASDSYATGCTLRFPRVVAFRDDKQWREATSFQQLLEMRARNEGKLGRQIDVSEASASASASASAAPRRRKRRVGDNKPQLGEQFRGVDAAGVRVVGQQLAGKEFCIVNGSASCPKAELERRVLQLGGSCVQHPGRGTHCVVAHDVNLKVRNIISGGRHDVVTASWLSECLHAGRLLTLRPDSLHHATGGTRARLRQEFDKFGDSYTEDTDREQLRRLLAEVADADDGGGGGGGVASAAKRQRLQQLSAELLPPLPALGCLRGLVFYLDRCLLLGDCDTADCDSADWLEVAADVQRHGGVIDDTLSPLVSHALLLASDLSRLRQLHAANRRRAAKFHIVTDVWLRDCLQCGKLCHERPYMPVA